MVHLTFPHTALPAPPTNLRVTFINSTSVNISWQAPPPVSTITIASYRLVVSENQFGLNDTIASSTTTSYTFTGLEEYNSYTCSVVAVSTYGVISSVTAISFTTPQEGTNEHSSCIGYRHIGSNLEVWRPCWCHTKRSGKISEQFCCALRGNKFVKVYTFELQNKGCIIF